jgi:EAL domain-containing protein (putative c-di-GMP-specific phosphodiesterase class I)
VLRTLCFAGRKWQDQGLPPVPIAVNVSAVQFRQDGFREFIKKVLDETRLSPGYLELELTESLLLSNADLTFPVLQDLKAMGLKLAIDDFGTGYSSLSYLRQFPVQKLKIDRSFIQMVGVSADDASITAAIISLGRSLNLKVIAEGVETEEQMSFLREHQCDEIQGYYFSKPLTTAETVDKLRGTLVENTLSASYGAP